MFCGESGNWVVLVRFALTRREGGPLPDDIEILSARLSVSKTNGYAPYLVLRPLAADWSEAEVCWNSAARGRDWKTPGGDVTAGPAAICDVAGAHARAGAPGSEAARKIWYGPWWCEFDVTDSLRAAVRQGRNFGWRMEAFGDQARAPCIPRVNFAGRLHAKDKKLRPRLVLKVRCRELTGNAGAAAGPERKVTLQDGLSVGGRTYSGTRDSYLEMHGTYAGKNNYGDKERMLLFGKTRRALVKFAVFRSEGGPVPDGAQVVSAKLHLFKVSAYLSGPRAHELLKAWDEKAVTAIDTGKAGPWAETGAGAAGQDHAAAAVGKCTLGYEKERWAEIDVTASLRAWSAKQRPNRGWLLIDEHPKDSVNNRHYATREYAEDASKRPKLEITYSIRK